MVALMDTVARVRLLPQKREICIEKQPQILLTQARGKCDKISGLSSK